jgi:hypothetical protein
MRALRGEHLVTLPSKVGGKQTLVIYRVSCGCKVLPRKQFEQICEAQFAPSKAFSLTEQTSQRALTYFYTKACKAGQPLPPAVARSISAKVLINCFGAAKKISAVIVIPNRKPETENKNPNPEL